MTEPMEETPMSDDRIERFKKGVADLDVAAAGGGRDRVFIALGLVLMAAFPNGTNGVDHMLR